MSCLSCWTAIQAFLASAQPLWLPFQGRVLDKEVRKILKCFRCGTYNAYCDTKVSTVLRRRDKKSCTDLQGLPSHHTVLILAYVNIESSRYCHYSSNSPDVRCCLHHFSVGDTSSVEHGLLNSEHGAWTFELASYLRAREVMAWLK
jgi:hypothetical protein